LFLNSVRARFYMYLYSSSAQCRGVRGEYTELNVIYSDIFAIGLDKALSLGK